MVPSLNAPDQLPHLRLDVLRVDESVAALLQVDARDAASMVASQSACMHLLMALQKEHSQEVALQPESHWCLRLDDDAACFGDVDVKDGLLFDPLGRGLRSQRRDQPKERMIRQSAS